MHRGHSKLKLEFLESRMLLSAIDIPQDAIAAGLKDGAIDSTDPQVDVNLDFNGRRLTITGPQDGDLSVDLNDVPASVVVLQISSFDSVTLTGAHQFASVVLSDVHAADLGNASVVDTLAAYGVERIHVGTLQSSIVILGASDEAGAQAVGGPTLLEFDQFSPPPGGDEIILANVEKLGLATNSHVTSLPTIAAMANEPIFLNFQPDIDPRSSILDVSIVTGGDFTQYFFASPAEQKNLEQTLTFTRHPIEVDFVPLATLLGQPAVQAVLGKANPAGSLPGSAGPSEALLAMHPHVSAPDNSAEVHTFAEGQISHSDTGTADAKLPFDLAAAPIVAVEPSVHFQPASNAASGAPITLSAFGVFDSETHPAEHFGEAVANAMHALASRLGQPFTRLASDFGAGLASFGDLAAAHFADHLKIDHQYALLVDARPVRTADERDVVIVTV